MESEEATLVPIDIPGLIPVSLIDYRCESCDNMRFWLSAHNCHVPTPTSRNLEVEQQIRIFGAD